MIKKKNNNSQLCCKHEAVMVSSHYRMFVRYNYRNIKGMTGANLITNI